MTVRMSCICSAPSFPPVFQNFPAVTRKSHITKLPQILLIANLNYMCLGTLLHLRSDRRNAQEGGGLRHGRHNHSMAVMPWISLASHLRLMFMILFSHYLSLLSPRLPSSPPNPPSPSFPPLLLTLPRRRTSPLLQALNATAD